MRIWLTAALLFSYCAGSRAQSTPNPEIRRLIDTRQLADAERRTVDQLSRNPRQSNFVLLLAEIRLDQRRYVESLQLIESARRLGAQSAHMSLLEGLNYVALGDAQKARPCLERAIEIDAQYSSAHYYLARLLYSMNDFEGACRESEEAVKLNPAAARAWDNLGLAVQALRKFDEAEHAFREAARLVDEQKLVWEYPALDEAKMLIELQRNREATAWLNRALQINPASAEAHLRMGVVMESEGHLREAIGQYEIAAKNDPSLRAAHYRAARLWPRLGDAARAKEEFAAFQRLQGSESNKGPKQ